MTGEFPRLTPDNHVTTSPATRRYNCIAWAASDDGRWWQPVEGEYWPLPDDADADLCDGLVRAYESAGFVACPDGRPEPGWQKVALYGNRVGRWTHAARLLPDGRWTSKLGRGEDIAHDTPDAVGGGIYGEVFAYMRRPLPAG